MSHTVEVLHGVPQHRYVIQLLVGDEPAALVMDGLGQRRIDWQRAWGVWRPFAQATFERLLAEFERLRQRPAIDDVNAELLQAGKASRGGAETRRSNGHASQRSHQSHSDSQLPVGDR